MLTYYPGYDIQISRKLFSKRISMRFTRDFSHLPGTIFFRNGTSIYTSRKEGNKTNYYVFFLPLFLEFSAISKAQKPEPAIMEQEIMLIFSLSS